MNTPKLLKWHDDGYPPFNKYRDFDNIRELITYAAELRKKVELLQSQPKQLSGEEAITAMFNRSKELELDLHKEEVEELYNVVRDRTGGGVDLESFIASVQNSFQVSKNEKALVMSLYKQFLNLTQPNQQEKG